MPINALILTLLRVSLQIRFKLISEHMLCNLTVFDVLVGQRHDQVEGSKCASSAVLK